MCDKIRLRVTSSPPALSLVLSQRGEKSYSSSLLVRPRPSLFLAAQILRNDTNITLRPLAPWPSICVHQGCANARSPPTVRYSGIYRQRAQLLKALSCFDVESSRWCNGTSVIRPHDGFSRCSSQGRCDSHVHILVNVRKIQILMI
jgi:hypothetical protein